MEGRLAHWEVSVKRRNTYAKTKVAETWTAFALYAEQKAEETSTPILKNFTKAKTLLNPDLTINAETLETLTYPKESIPLYNSVTATIDDQIISLSEKSKLITKSS